MSEFRYDIGTSHSHPVVCSPITDQNRGTGLGGRAWGQLQGAVGLTGGLDGG